DIARMPMGMHTVLSETGGTISGGQQQRILIARAILGKPKIIFFDEATSALDNVTQAMVCESLNKLDSTRLVIAHRLSTIMDCDRILVMDKGEIVEEGNFEALMEKKGIFYELASRQMA
ncbi:MAG TPA: NHLP family bacteriocin export ABC transporter permease/ATPase subunit, partial [Lachnospiraceae bacterium]|nr:NHLP family bacteriocin export ABC transporter permease/ATPase subunit [Lachnospiraceae bacterium]